MLIQFDWRVIDIQRAIHNTSAVPSAALQIMSMSRSLSDKELRFVVSNTKVNAVQIIVN